MSSGPQLRHQVLSLFRALLREARHMPTANRRQHIEKKARHEFRTHAKTSDPSEVDQLVALGELQLDNVRRQAQHLNVLKAQGNLKS